MMASVDYLHLYPVHFLYFFSLRLHQFTGPLLVLGKEAWIDSAFLPYLLLFTRVNGIVRTNLCAAAAVDASVRIDVIDIAL